jgi:hypothetical protein
MCTFRLVSANINCTIMLHNAQVTKCLPFGMHAMCAVLDDSLAHTFQAELSRVQYIRCSV